MNPQRQDDIMNFFFEVHLLAGKLVSVVANPSLEGSHANRHHMPNLQLGAAQATGDEDPQAIHNPLEMTFVIFHRKGTRTLHNPSIRARDKHHPLLNDPRCSKPSRCRQH
jgi:hypothetical protein